MRTYIFILLVIVTTTPILAQNSKVGSQRVGLFGNVDAAINAASFTGLPDVPSCCPEYSTSTDIGWLAGISYIRPLTPTWTLHVRGHYGQYGGSFQSLENEPTIGPGGVEEQATIQHDLTTAFSQISIEPLAGYHLTRDLSLLGGLTLGYVFSAKFDQNETLIEPIDAVFGSQSRERNTKSNEDIADASVFNIGLTIGASYDIALNADRSVFISPEVLFTFSPIPQVSGISYNIHHLRAGLALSFVPPAISDSLYGQELYEFARGIDAPTSTSPSVPFVSRVTAVGLNADGTPLPVNELQIEEFTSRRIRPLLPYVFFDESSQRLPDRYYRVEGDLKQRFSMENFYNLDALVTYRHLLNIVGRRMLDNPSATIVLVGCATPQERGGEDLAQARAKVVRDYLTTTWGIDGSRIQIESRGLPEQASNMAEADGRAENQRVEITSSDPLILAAVTSDDTMRVSTPTAIRFNTSIDPRIDVRSWTLFVSADGGLRKFFHDGNPVPESITWRPTEESGVIPKRVRELAYLLAVTDTTGAVIPSETKYLPVRLTTLADKQGSDKQIDRYSMILFGFDSDQITSTHRKMISEFGATIKTNSKVKITGFTDRTGDASHNMSLSERRAKAVARQLGVSETDARGLGESMLLYDNSTPEGRFYSRTVEVIVESPKN